MNNKGPITSYAQNFEDVILWRALGHVVQGNYVDVGAQSAIEDSVSMAFHERGWKGVHVEPVSMYAQQLRDGRPGDIVLQAVVGCERGTREFFAIPGTGLSTLRDDLALGYESDGRPVSRTVFPVVTLDDVLSTVEGQIHWLKIDVEGAEEDVIAGWSSTHRPWVLVIESTLPTSQQEDFASWEDSVLSKGYEFVYFDGLNRFYLHEHHADLKKFFRSGPNVFDGFSLSGTATSTFANSLNRRIAEAESGTIEANRHIEALEKLHHGERLSYHKDLSGLQANLTDLQMEMVRQQAGAAEREKSLIESKAWALTHAAAMATHSAAMDAQVEKLHAELLAMHTSRSWLVTAPFRSASHAVQFFPAQWARVIHTTKRAVMCTVFAMLRRIDRVEMLKKAGHRLLNCIPSGVEGRVRAWHSYALACPAGKQSNASNLAFGAQPSVESSDLLPAHLSASARQNLLRFKHRLQSGQA